jgi:FMN phosphatase YigB (HAD superfamily)
MKIFIDFDDVIFNTREFITDFKKVFKANDISEEIFDKYYYDTAEQQSNIQIKKYDADRHIQRIKEVLHIDTGQLEEDFAKFINDTSKYIFPDVRNFLEQFERADLYLISYGDLEYQRNKIKNSGITKYFNKVITTYKLKAEELAKILSLDEIESEDIYFLDDRVEQIRSVKKKFPQAHTLLVRRKEGRYNDEKDKYCDFEVGDLNEAARIISNF